jgi:hypothetical protein
MRRCLLRISVVRSMVAFALFAVSVPAESETKTVTVSAKRPPGWISSTVFSPGNVPNHVLASCNTAIKEGISHSAAPRYTFGPQAHSFGTCLYHSASRSMIRELHTLTALPSSVLLRGKP